MEEDDEEEDLIVSIPLVFFLMYRFYDLRFLITVMKETTDIRPALLAFALSLGGILYSFLRTKRTTPAESPPPSLPSDSGYHVGSEGELAGCKNDVGNTFIAPEKHEESCLPTDNYILGLSPCDRSNGGNDGFLLPEFDELLKEFDLAAAKSCSSPRKDVETITSDATLQKGYKVVKRDDHEQEIKSLRNMVTILKERERALEIQLLEYYGLKEQETAVMELHNRLKIYNTEAKLLSLKIESLQADNRRLEAQVTDYAKVVSDLEAARANIKLLKRKLRYDAEQNKQQILALRQRVTKLQEREHVAVVSNLDIQPKLQKLKDLEEEEEELRKSSYNLQLENSDLGQRLNYAQALATAVLENEETAALKEESRLLRKQNEDLTKEIEQLQDDRCADAEELVYMRWINACLRYELRNFQPGPGETVARDLSRTLSPKSEEKAKQLILEYANKEGLGRRVIYSTEFDTDHLSSSLASSCLTDFDDSDDSSVDNSFASKTNKSSRRRIFGGLIKLLRGQGHHHRDSRDSSPEVPESLEVVVGRKSTDTSVYNSGVPAGSDGQSNKSRTSSVSSSRPLSESSRLSLDRHKFPYFQRLKTEKTDGSSDLEGVQKNSDDARSSSAYKKNVSFSEDVSASPQENEVNEDLETDEKSHLLKYAEALTDRCGKTSKFHRRSASFSSL